MVRKGKGRERGGGGEEKKEKYQAMEKKERFIPFMSNNKEFNGKLLLYIATDFSYFTRPPVDSHTFF